MEMIQWRENMNDSREREENCCGTHLNKREGMGFRVQMRGDRSEHRELTQKQERMQSREGELWKLPHDCQFSQ